MNLRGSLLSVCYEVTTRSDIKALSFDGAKLQNKFYSVVLCSRI